VLVAVHDESGGQRMSVGEHFLRKSDNVATRVLREGRIAPIVVDGREWGVAVVSFYRTQPFPPDTEARLTDFAELVAMAIANAQVRSGPHRVPDENRDRLPTTPAGVWSGICTTGRSSGLGFPRPKGPHDRAVVARGAGCDQGAAQ
jgi:hypothetical protein